MTPFVHPDVSFDPQETLRKAMAFIGRLALLLIGASAAVAQTADLDSCPGYNAQNVQTNGASITADLSLAGTACNVYGNDTQSLKLEVTYETGAFLLTD